jgi:hypothetical protein
MADFGKVRRNLPSPPPMEEASQNLQAPEVAPIAPERPQSAPLADPEPEVEATGVERQPETPRARRDGRTLRRTNRTIAFATRVSAEWDDRIRDIAERDGLKLVEVLEKALDAYENRRRKR